MPRCARHFPPDGVLHVFSRGVDRQDVFRSDGDRRSFLAFLQHYLRMHKISLFAYCLMNNHFHLLLAPTTEPLGVAMHQILTRYSLYFNRRHARVGHLFQNRYKAKICASDAYLYQLIAYIHLNPVRAGLVAKPGAWPWSSHEDVLVGAGTRVDLARLADITGHTVAELVEAYREKVSGLERAAQSCGMPIDELLDMAAGSLGVSVQDIVDGVRGEAQTKARRLLVYWASRQGYGLGRIAETLNCAKATVAQFRKEGVRLNERPPA